MSNNYADRNKTLKHLGFLTYSDYLVSPLWRGIRARAFAKHGKRCRLCPAPADVIHHISYGRQVLTGNDISLLVPLCDSCHVAVEFRANGRKREVSEAQTTYRRLLKIAVNNGLAKPGLKEPKFCPTCNRRRSSKNPFRPCKGCEKGLLPVPKTPAGSKTYPPSARKK